MARPGDIEHNFAYHPPATPEIAELHGEVRRILMEAALDISEFLGDNRETSLFLTKMEEAMMWANASIARNANREM